MDEPVGSDPSERPSPVASASGRVSVERSGPVGTIVFDNPARRNAITVDMWRVIPEACRTLDADPTVRVVVLRGAGTAAFVAGADISEFEVGTAADRPDADAVRPGQHGYDRLTQDAFSAVAEISKPVLACIHGVCVGGGLALAAAADLRYAADDARFGLPPARLGLGYGAEGTGTLVDLLGPAVTKEIIFTADLFDADSALGWGLVNRIVPADDLDRFVADRAEVIASRAPLSLRATKLAVADHLRSSERKRPDEVAAAIAACARSEDYREGVAAFREKRQPRFHGR